MRARADMWSIWHSAPGALLACQVAGIDRWLQVSQNVFQCVVVSTRQTSGLVGIPIRTPIEWLYWFRLFRPIFFFFFFCVCVCTSIGSSFGNKAFDFVFNTSIFDFICLICRKFSILVLDAFFVLTVLGHLLFVIIIRLIKTGFCR